MTMAFDKTSRPSHRPTPVEGVVGDSLASSVRVSLAETEREESGKKQRLWLHEISVGEGNIYLGEYGKASKGGQHFV